MKGSIDGKRLRLNFRKTLNSKDKEKILQPSRKKEQVVYKIKG